MLSCCALVPAHRGVPASGTVQPMRLRSVGAGTPLIQARGSQASGATATGGCSTGVERTGPAAKRRACRCQQLKMGSKQLPPEQENPLKWPACANLGKELCDSILPALRSLTKDPAMTKDPAYIEYIEAARQTAMAELDSVGDWLDAPCSATVKLDGTNLGVGVYWEGIQGIWEGIVVGRNYVVPRQELYQKVDVHALLNDPGNGRSDVPTKIRRLTDEFELACAYPLSEYRHCGPGFGWAALRVMLYGELIVNQGKYDYEAAGIFRRWLCFGVLIGRVLPGTPFDDFTTAEMDKKDAEDMDQLAAALQAAGWNCQRLDDDQGERVQPLIRIGPNEQLMSLLQTLDISTVSHDYQPRQGKLLTDIESAQWAEHTGAGGLPRFASLRELILSEWASRFFMPASQGGPLGEGLVVCSEPGAKLTKWKHGGEEAGSTPAKLAEAVELLHGLDPSVVLPQGLLEICERLQLVATSGAGPKKSKKAAGMKEKQQVKAKAENDALAVWSSTLTKFDSLEATFSKGLEAKAALEVRLIEQVALDLETDYFYEPSKARARATGVVKAEMGKRYAWWARARAGDPFISF